MRILDRAYLADCRGGASLIIAGMPGETATLPVDALHAVDASGRLASDVACVQCGYNLRGALGPPEGRCPECGLPVGRSTMGHWLRFAEPDWLRTVWGGMNRLAVLIVCSAVISDVVFSGYMAAQLLWGDEVLRASTLLFACTGLVVGLHGIWRVTTPEPVQIGERPASVRRLTRWFAVALVVAVIVATLDALYLLQAFLYLPETVDLLPYLLLIVVSSLLLWYARGLARRVPRPGLAQATLAVFVLFVASGLVSVIVMRDWYGWHSMLTEWYHQRNRHFPNFYGSSNPYVGWAAPHTWLQDARTASRVLRTGTLLALALLFVWYWVVLRREARRASETWAGEAADATAMRSRRNRLRARSVNE